MSCLSCVTLSPRHGYAEFSLCKCLGISRRERLIDSLLEQIHLDSLNEI
jgi:hypothetical protein